MLSATSPISAVKRAIFDLRNRNFRHRVLGWRKVVASMNRMRRLALAFAPVCLLSSVWAQFPGATPPPAEFKKGFETITIKKAQDILGYLAGPECEGRGTGQVGYQKAAEYVAKKFKEAGLKPMGDNGTYFQNMKFYRTWTANAMARDAAGKVLADKGLAINPRAQAVDLTGPVVVVRSTDGQAALSDADEKALSGKIVVMLTPSGRSRLRTQVSISDAKLVLTISEGTPLAGASVRTTPSNAGTSSVSGRISREAAAQLSPMIDAFLRTRQIVPAQASLYDPHLELHVTAEGKSEEVKVPNVVGLLEGSDPTLKNEYVGVGAHLDHLGVSNGVVYPGADDDGSGSTAVMLVAEAMAKNPVKPKRSILFMTFCGEEMGLLGSGYLSDNSPVPLAKMIAELQMDMVGRDSYGPQNGDSRRIDKVEENLDTMRLVGSKRISTDLDKTIQDINAHIGFKFKYDSEDVYTRSDHYNFARKGIPIAFLFDGFTPDYHAPTDTVDKINFLKLTNAAKLYYLTALTLANNPQAPRHDVKN